MLKKIALALLVAAPLSAPAVAAPVSGSSAPTGSVATLEAVSRVSPTDGGAAVELAQAYLRADRPGEAANAYRRALTLDNVMLETPTGDSIWSHQVAKQALSSATVLSSR